MLGLWLHTGGDPSPFYPSSDPVLVLVKYRCRHVQGHPCLSLASSAGPVAAALVPFATAAPRPGMSLLLLPGCSGALVLWCSAVLLVLCFARPKGRPQQRFFAPFTNYQRIARGYALERPWNLRWYRHPCPVHQQHTLFFFFFSF